jgi:hypothetical protein
MPQNLDKNKIRDSIQKARPQDLFCVSINTKDKNSLKEGLMKVLKFVGEKKYGVIVFKE